MLVDNCVCVPHADVGGSMTQHAPLLILVGLLGWVEPTCHTGTAGALIMVPLGPSGILSSHAVPGSPYDEPCPSYMTETWNDHGL